MGNCSFASFKIFFRKLYFCSCVAATEEWNKFFLVSSSRPALPTVFQSISHRVFKCLLEE